MKETILKSLFLTMCIFACSFSVTAQDIIKFTWSVVGSQVFQFHATEGKEYTIDWGDGSAIETKVGIEGWSFPNHTYSALSEYQVIITAGSEDCLFGYFDCANKNVGSIDMSKNPSLGVLYCSDNQLINLDLSNNSYLLSLNCSNNLLTSLEVTKSVWGHNLHFDCSNNKLLLSKLYTISQIIGSEEFWYKIFGTQIIDTKNSTLFDFSGETDFDGFATVFDVKKDTVPAIVNFDYTIIDGIICFKQNGNFVVRMTNEAIGSSAEVVAEFNVNVDGIADCTKSSNFVVYPNPTTGSVYIKTGVDEMPKIILYSAAGSLLQSIQGFELDMSDYPVGIYLLKVNCPNGNIYSTKIIKK
ncbi:MAG: T9SS type A sorting domain-containing protein [Bacteroidales bacterium]|jgi:hypothetical protein|nr:T9SS type A sorting domain-containing protein [Bacteroidales bacterium]